MGKTVNTKLYRCHFYFRFLDDNTELHDVVFVAAKRKDTARRRFRRLVRATNIPNYRIRDYDVVRMEPYDQELIRDYVAECERLIEEFPDSKHARSHLEWWRHELEAMENPIR